MNCEFCELIEYDNEYFVGETKYWKIYLANDQNYPGRCIIPLKVHRNNLCELTMEEFADMKTVVDILEKISKETFGATNFNWTCLMNGGYAVTPPNPHVHLHFIPRYKEPYQTRDGAFVDETFGTHYILQGNFGRDLRDRSDWAQALKIAFEKEIQTYK